MLIDDKQVCDHCKTEIIMWPQFGKMNSPMIKDNLWLKVLKYYKISTSKLYTFICDKCMEKALKRKLIAKDLKPYPLSNDWAEENL